MNRTPAARLLGPITIVLAVLTTWAFSVRVWMAGPLAVVYVVAAFWWHIQRPGPAGVGARQAKQRQRCTGCRAGCVECRERIDLEEA
jgi:hypothetical protein